MRQPDLWVILDLGGVLFNFDGIQGLAEITARTPEHIHQALISSPSIEQLETGRMAPDAFAAALVTELSLPVSTTEFLDLWTNWESGEKPGTFELLETLGERFNLACLSNTSVVHWQRLHDLRGIGRRFHRHYASHLIGRWKPDPRIFAHVTQDLGPAVTRIIYFDDNDHIVSAAQDFGWDAHKALAPADVAARLNALGLMD